MINVVAECTTEGMTDARAKRSRAFLLLLQASVRTGQRARARVRWPCEACNFAGRVNRSSSREKDECSSIQLLGATGPLGTSGSRSHAAICWLHMWTYRNE